MRMEVGRDIHKRTNTSKGVVQKMTVKVQDQDKSRVTPKALSGVIPGFTCVPR